MNRSVNRSANNTVATAADYAAQSGINEAITLLENGTPINNPDDCRGLIDNSPARNDTTKPIKQFPTSSPAQYTCILVSSDSVPTVIKDPISSLKAWVVKLKTSPTANSFTFSWNCTPTACPNSPNAATTPTLLDETTWNNNGYAPVLRVTLYPIPDSESLTHTQDHSRTYFIYPSQAGRTTDINYQTDRDGSLIPVKCTGTGEFYCVATITNLTSALTLTDGGENVRYFWAHITPIYTAAKVQVTGEDSSGGGVGISGTQALIDITAKTSTSVKRLQAHVSIDNNSTEDSAPDTSLRSAVSLCKTEKVYQNYTRPLGSNYNNPCNYNNLKQPNNSQATGPPVRTPTLAVTFSGPGSAAVRESVSGTTTITCNYVSPNTTSTSSDPLNYPTNRCWWGYENQENVLVVLSNLSGQYGSPTITWDNGCAQNATSCTVAMTQDHNVVVAFPTAPPPTVNLSANPTTVTAGQSSTLTWSTTNATSCTASGDWSGTKGTSGSESDVINTTNHYTLTCTGPGGSGSASTTVTVGATSWKLSLNKGADGFVSVTNFTDCGSLDSQLSGPCIYSTNAGDTTQFVAKPVNYDHHITWSRWIMECPDGSGNDYYSYCASYFSSCQEGRYSARCTVIANNTYDPDGDANINLDPLWVWDSGCPDWGGSC